MGEQTRNMLIGLFVTAACLTLIWIILFLKPTIGDGKQTLYVRFANINQINIGTRVLFAGKPVGEVVAIEQVPDARQKPISDVLGEIYYFQLVLKIDSSVRVYNTDEITVQTSGLLGEKSVAILPKTPPKGIIPHLITGKQPIYAQSVDPIADAFYELTSLSREMKHTFQLASHWMQKNGSDLGNAIRSFGTTMDEVHVAVAKINKDSLIDDIQKAAGELTATLAEIKQAVGQMQAGNLFTNASIAIESLKDTSHNLSSLSQDLLSGKGTLGQLFAKDDFYLHMNSVLSKVDTLMNDVNHYGLLFHLNKGWQRQRSKQLATLHSLKKPEQFNAYFQTEISEINSAMSRLSLLVDKTQPTAVGNPETSSQFKKEFRDLLQKADSLSNNLKLYNEQLSSLIEQNGQE